MRMALILLAAAALPAVAQNPTVVVVVRHAERADTTRDPGLSPAGELRARELAEALRDARVTAIITTQFRRSQLTAAPLAQLLGLTPIVVPAQRDVAAHARATADSARSRGGTVLVVGHSNTINRIIGALGGPQLADLCDSDYDNLYIFTLDASAAASLVRGTFGAADSAGPECRR